MSSASICTAAARCWACGGLAPPSRGAPRAARRGPGPPPPPPPRPVLGGPPPADVVGVDLHGGRRLLGLRRARRPGSEQNREPDNHSACVQEAPLQHAFLPCL